MIASFICPERSPLYVCMPFYLKLQTVPILDFILNVVVVIQVSIVSTLIMNATESINMALTIQRIYDPEQSLLVEQQWEVSDPILSCSNLQDLPIHFSSNPEDLMICFHVWESGPPLCIVPQVFHFLELVVWCADHFSLKSNSVVSKQLSQIVIKISK